MKNNNDTVKQFDPLGIFNFNIQSEFYAKDLLNGELVVKEKLIELSRDGVMADFTNTTCINKADTSIH